MERESAEPLFEVPAPAAAHDVHARIRKRRQRTQERADLRSRLREVGMELELTERPVVVEEDRALTRARETPREAFPNRVVQSGRPLGPAITP